MGKKKLIYFEENKGFECLLELSARELLAADHEFKGKWNRSFFSNDNSVVLELGCGRGEYTLELAKKCPDKNFIGIDIKGSRLFHGAKVINDLNVKNAGFVRTKIDFVDKLFDKEISEIWVTFPDPFPEKPNRILTSPVFLNRYFKALLAPGLVHLKTDDTNLYNFTKWVASENGLEVIFDSDDIYKEGVPEGFASIQTTYEKKFLEQGKKICMISFVLNKEVEALDKKKIPTTW